LRIKNNVLKLQISALNGNASLAKTQKAMERRTNQLQKALETEQEV